MANVNVLEFRCYWTTKNKKSKKKQPKSTIKKAGIITSKNIIPATGLTTTFEADQNDTTGVIKTTQKLVPLSYTIILSDSLGVNVRSEISSWKSLVGKSGSIYVGGSKFAASKFSLLSAEVSDVLLDDFGRMRNVTMNLSFIEKNATKSKRMKAASSDKSAKKPKNKNAKKAKSTKKKSKSK